MTLLSFKSPKLTVRLVTLAAMLIAIQIIFSKLTVGSDSLVKVGFGFIGICLIGYYLGPWLGGVAMALTDIISNTILASSANFFIGFTVGAFLSGVIAGLFLYDQPVTLKRQFTYQAIQILVSNIFLNTLWLHIMYTTPLTVLLAVRIPKNLILFPIQALIAYSVLLAVMRSTARLGWHN